MSSKGPAFGNDYFFIRHGSRHHRIDFARVRIIEARKSYCRIDLGDKTLVVRTAIGQLEAVLPPDEFCRIHRSYIVSIAHIEWFEYNLLRVADREIPIGRAYRGELPGKLGLVVAESRKTPVLDTGKWLVLG